MSAIVEVSRVENALASMDTGQAVDDVAWFCEFDAPGILIDFAGEYRVLVNRQVAIKLGHSLIEAGRDDSQVS